MKDAKHDTTNIFMYSGGMDLKNAATHIEAHDVQDDTKHTQHKKQVLGAVFVLMFFFDGIGMSGAMHYALAHGMWSIVIVSGIFTLTLFLLLAVLSPITPWRIGAVVAFLLPLMLWPPSIVTLLCGVIAFALLVYYTTQIRFVLDNMREIRIRDAFRSGVGGILIAVAILLSGQYYALIVSRNVDDLLPRVDHLTAVHSLVERFIVKNNSGGVLTVDHFLEQFVQRQFGTIAPTTEHLVGLTRINDTRILGQASIGEMITRITKKNSTHMTGALTESLKKSIVERTRKDLSQAIGTSLHGSEDIVDVVILFMRAQIKKAIVSNPAIMTALPKVLAIFFFLTILSFSIIFRGIAVIVARGVFALLAQTSLFSLVKKPRNVERISFSSK